MLTLISKHVTLNVLPFNFGIMWLLLFRDYAADDVTHCIRPKDIKERRTVIILRRCV
jgi:hypothetical protein